MHLRSRLVTAPRRFVTMGALGLVSALALAACSAGGNNDTSGSGSVPAFDEASGGAEEAGAARSVSDFGADSDGRAASSLTRHLSVERAVIQRAALTVRAKDVGRALAQAEATVTGVGGFVASERTEARKNGNPRYSTLTVRVPVDDFDAVLDDLADLGVLEQQSRSAKDVTGDVIDVESRLDSAQAAIKRIRLLLSRAQNLGDVIRLESELSDRQSELEALDAQRSYLADQTSLATIDVTLLAPDAPAPPKEEDDSGFLAGLRSGWDGLVSLLTGLATALGAVLPFAALVALVGLPIWLLILALLRRRPSAVPVADSAPPSAG